MTEHALLLLAPKALVSSHLQCSTYYDVTSSDQILKLSLLIYVHCIL